ncbi:MAG: hypothetical protein ACKO3K_08075 [Cuspidothrix sp.]
MRSPFLLNRRSLYLSQRPAPTLFNYSTRRSFPSSIQLTVISPITSKPKSFSLKSDR